MMKVTNVIGSGAEGTVYKDSKHFATKVFKPHVSAGKQKREFRFLKRFQSTRVVPRLVSDESFLIRARAIRMEYLDNYITLKTFKTEKKNYSPKKISKLIRELARARILIGYNTEYHDLHLGNVMIWITPSDVGPVRVKFIDPGESTIHSTETDVWFTWLESVCRDLGLVRHPILGLLKKSVRSFRVTVVQ